MRLRLVLEKVERTAWILACARKSLAQVVLAGSGIEVS